MLKMKEYDVFRIIEGLIITFLSLLTFGFLAMLLCLTEIYAVRIIAVVFAAILWVAVLMLLLICRRRFIRFSEGLSRNLDSLIMSEDKDHFELEAEMMSSKIQAKLNQLYNITTAAIAASSEQKQEVQKIVSDISHQLKTPIANIKMYADTVANPQVPDSKRQFFMEGLKNQVDKLDFLIQVLTKISRLENGQIVLKQEEASFYSTLAQAMSGIIISAKKKAISVAVHCDESLVLYHDSKWTAEALFNILENAVKYTNKGGKINVMAEQWEMYTKIDITDTGIGIAEKHINDIFKRFYREDKVHSIEGIGVGLYLTREIITMQQGYIRVKTQEGQGSVFSVFLPNYKS